MPASLLHQAPLALRRAGALSRDVRAAGRARRRTASEEERRDPHPVVAAFMAHEESLNFSRDEVRETVIPTYMGLISQFDRHVGRVVAHLDRRGLAEDTIVIVTSDHGDYLGDHWLGEKDLFHEEVVRIPLIVADPRPQAPTRARGRGIRCAGRGDRSRRRPSSTGPAARRSRTGSKGARCAPLIAVRGSAGGVAGRRVLRLRFRAPPRASRRSACRRTGRAATWCAPRAGNTCSSRIFRRSSSTSKPTPRS